MNNRLQAVLLLVLVLPACHRQSSESPKRPSNVRHNKIPDRPRDVPCLVPNACRPPDPGLADIRVEGAYSLVVKSPGVQCSKWASAAFEFVVESRDALGMAKGAPSWQLRGVTTWKGEPDRRQITLRVDSPKRLFVWRGTPSELNRIMTRDKNVVRLAATLRDENSNKSVKLRATLRCPSPASRPPACAARILKKATNATVRDYFTSDFGRVKHREGMSVIVALGDAPSLVRKLRARLPKGLTAFVGTNRFFGDDKPKGVELVVVRVGSQFDILRHARSNALNYDLTVEGQVKQLQKWNERFGISIWFANSDTIQFTLKRLPTDMTGFARAVYAFCPDVVDQGVESVDALAKLISGTRNVYLWWD